MKMKMKEYKYKVRFLFIERKYIFSMNPNLIFYKSLYFLYKIYIYLRVT